MNEQELFSYSNYEKQTHLAERELAEFIKSVTERFGPEQVGAAIGDWLEEADLIDAPPLSISRNWHAVTVAASARLSNHVDVPQNRQISLRAYTDTKVSFIPSFNCSTSTHLV
jgi:hypothetical protein